MLFSYYLLQPVNYKENFSMFKWPVVIGKLKEYLIRNGDEITSTSRRTDLGQVCSI